MRGADVDVVVNLTCGMGGDLMLGSPQPLPPDPDATDMAGAEERLAHVVELLPEICTLDCGSMNFAPGGEFVMVNTVATLRTMAARVQELGVRPELEVFDSGHMVLVHELIRDGLLDDPVLIQLCCGIPYGAPADPATLLAMAGQLPAGAVFSAFAIGRMQLPFVALAPVIGGNVRVGLEDNLYLSRGELATNGQLVERAVRILEAMNVRVLGPGEVRERLALRQRGLVEQPLDQGQVDRLDQLVGGRQPVGGHRAEQAQAVHAGGLGGQHACLGVLDHRHLPGLQVCHRRRAAGPAPPGSPRGGAFPPARRQM